MEIEKQVEDAFRDFYVRARNWQPKYIRRLVKALGSPGTLKTLTLNGKWFAPRPGNPLCDARLVSRDPEVRGGAVCVVPRSDLEQLQRLLRLASDAGRITYDRMIRGLTQVCGVLATQSGLPEGEDN